MAVIQPWYDPSRERHPSALITYMDAFVGVRSDLNRKILEQHFAKMDPAALQAQMNQLRSNIAELQSERSRLVREGVSAQGDVATNLVGIFSGSVSGTKAAWYGALGHQAGEQVRAEVDLERMDAEDRKRHVAASNLNESQIGHIAGAAVDARRPGTTQTDAYLGRISAALTGLDEKGQRTHDPVTSGQQKDYIAMSAWQTAVANGDTEGATAIQKMYFPGESSPVEAYARDYGAATKADRDATRQRVTRGRIPTPDIPRDIQQLAEALPSILGGATGQDGRVSDPLGLERMWAATDQGTALLDQQLQGAQAELARLQALEQQAREAPLTSPFSINWMTQSPFHQRAWQQDPIDAAARSNPTMVDESLGYLRTRGSIEDGALQRGGMQVEGGQMDPRKDGHARNYQEITPGMGIYDWAAQRLDAISRMSFNTDARKALRDQAWEDFVDAAALLPDDVRAQAPELWKGVWAGEDPATLAQTAGALAIERDIPIEAVIASQLAAVQRMTDPEQQVRAANQVAQWSAALPEDLAGSWGGQRASSGARYGAMGDITGRIQDQDGPGLLQTVQALQQTAERYARGEVGVPPARVEAPSDPTDPMLQNVPEATDPPSKVQRADPLSWVAPATATAPVVAPPPPASAPPALDPQDLAWRAAPASAPEAPAPPMRFDEIRIQGDPDAVLLPSATDADPGADLLETYAGLQQRQTAAKARLAAIGNSYAGQGEREKIQQELDTLDLHLLKMAPIVKQIQQQAGQDLSDDEYLGTMLR